MGDGMGKEGRKEEDRRKGKGQEMEKVKKKRKRTLNWSVPPHPHSLTLKSTTHTPTSNTHTKHHPPEKSSKSLFSHGIHVQKQCSLAVSTYADTNPHHYFLSGKATTEKQTHVARQYICWVNWSQTPLFMLQEEGNKDPLPFTPI